MQTRFANNLIFSAISRSSDILFLLLIIVAARYLGDVHFGKFSYAFAIVSIFEVFTDFGLKELVIREVARNKSLTVDIVGNTLTLKLALAFLMLIIIFSLAFLTIDDMELRLTIVLLSLSTAFKSIKFLFRSVLIAYERFGLESIIIVIERGLIFVVGCLVLILGYGLIEFSAVFAAVNFLNLLLSVIVVRAKICTTPFLFDFSLMMRLLKSAFPFCLTIAAAYLYFRLDSIMLAVLRDNAEVGWYNASYRIIEGLIVLPTIFYYVLFPRLSRLPGDSQSFEQLAQRVLKYIIALGFLISVVGYYFSDEIILLIYGHEYFNSISSFRILMIGALPMFIWNIAIVILNSINREILAFYGLLLGTLVNVILNLFLIPVYGQVGASISTVICEFVVFVFLFTALGTLGIRLLLLRQLMIPAVSAIIIYIFFLSLQGVAPLLLIIFSPVVFVIALIAMGFFDAREYKLILELTGISRFLSSSGGH